MAFGDFLDWNSAMYYVYDRDYRRANGGIPDKVIYEGGSQSSGSVSEDCKYTEDEQNKVQEAFEHASRTDNPHNVQIGQINGLSDRLAHIEDTVEAAGMYDAANAVTSATGGATIVVNENNQKEVKIVVEEESAVAINNNKITLEWENY